MESPAVLEVDVVELEQLAELCEGVDAPLRRAAADLLGAAGGHQSFISSAPPGFFDDAMTAYRQAVMEAGSRLYQLADTEKASVHYLRAAAALYRNADETNSQEITKAKSIE